MSLFGNLNNNQSNSSLFSTPSTSAQTGSSLFAGLNASKPAGSTPSLFGASTQAQQPQQQPASTGGLYGGLSAAQQNKPPNGGLFSNTTQSTQPAQSTSLFGSAPQSQPQQTSSLFGATPQSQPQSQPSQTSSLFGAPVQQQQQQPASQPQPERSTPAVFDSLLEKGRKRPHGETALGDMPSLHFDLGSIRKKLNTLRPDGQNRSNSGRAHYLITGSGVDPAATARDLHFFESQTTGIDKSQATAAPDTDVESYLANLQNQTTLGMIADGLSRSVRDFDAFLDDNVAIEWDIQRKRIYQHFGIKARDLPGGASRIGSLGQSRSEAGGFGFSARRGKQTLNGSRGPSIPNGASTFGRSNLQRSVIGTPAPIGTGHQSLFPDVEKKVEATGPASVASPEDRFVREKQRKFMDKIQNLNISRLRGQMYPLLQELADIEAQSSDQHVQHVVNSYKALIEMIGENPEIQSSADPKAVKERQFSEAYLDDTPNSTKAMKVRKMILAGANRYLEKQFYQELESLVIKNPKEANLGGVPSVINKVKAYVRLRASRNDLSPDDTNLQVIGNDYAWPIVFYSLRAGYVKDAAEYVTSNAVAFRAIDRNFVTYITDYYNSSERRLRRELQDRINNEYNQRLRVGPDHTIDPYRMACYKIIGRCGIDTRTIEDCNQGINDWIWLQFNLAREVNRVDEIASEVYGLEEIRLTVKEIGSRHFAKGAGDQTQGLGMYFYLQILAGLFEEAIAYLYTSQYVDAVHFAIGLEYYGLLRASDSVTSDSDLLTKNVRERPQISFGRMLGYYTRDFRAANVGAAVDYLTLICLNKDLAGEAGQQQVVLCHEALRELILESREFPTLLGDIRGDGERIPGCIEERLTLIGLETAADFMRTVTIQAASMADENGRTTDAVLLFHLAQEFDNVIVIINRALSEAVALDIGQDKLKLAPLKPRIETDAEHQVQSLSLTAIDDPVELAKSMMNVYNANALLYNKIRSVNREACGILLRMSEAKEMVTVQRWTEALDMIESLNILPLQARGDWQKIHSAANNFSALPQEIARNVPNLIAWAVESCVHQSSHLSQGQFGGNDGARRMLVEELNQKQQDIVLYSQTIKYKLPASVSGLLARASVQGAY